MLLRLALLLLVVAYLAHRFRPQQRLPWTVPLAVVGVLLVVRTVGWLMGD